MSEEKDLVNEGKEFRQSMMDKLEVEYSAAETIKPEEDKKKYIQAMEERLAKLKVMTDEMKEKSKNVSKEASAEFDREIEKLKGLQAEARSRLNDVRESGSGAWQKLRDSSMNAWKELADGVKKAVGKFR
jgi:FKBP-type peptidyl-prolyl cis-trans isomerase